MDEREVRFDGTFSAYQKCCESGRKAADINPAAEAATWNLGIFFQNRRLGIATAN